MDNIAPPPPRGEHFRRHRSPSFPLFEMPRQHDYMYGPFLPFVTLWRAQGETNYHERSTWGIYDEHGYHCYWCYMIIGAMLLTILGQLLIWAFQAAMYCCRRAHPQVVHVMPQPPLQKEKEQKLGSRKSKKK